MKVEVEVKPTPEKDKYPYIGIDVNQTIVLFYCEQRGTVLESRSFNVGYNTTWNESIFKKFEGKITLSND